MSTDKWTHPLLSFFRKRIGAATQDVSKHPYMLVNPKHKENSPFQEDFFVSCVVYFMVKFMVYFKGL